MTKVSLFAKQERETKLDRIGDALSKLAQYVDFAALAAEIDEAAPRPAREPVGRPPFSTELMVRVLVVQQLYSLSDEQMEFQLLGRRHKLIRRVHVSTAGEHDTRHFEGVQGASLEQMGGKALRSIGLARATLHLNWKAAAYNLRHLCPLKEVGPMPF